MSDKGQVPVTHFIVMRHWADIHQDGNLWCGAFDTDETDWQLAELIVNMQYACQRHFFGAMAEKYFDNKYSELQTLGKRHRQKSVDGYNRLPEVFTYDDVIRCFNYDNINTVYTKVRRLVEDHLIVRISNGLDKGKYKKVNSMIV